MGCFERAKAVTNEQLAALAQRLVRAGEFAQEADGRWIFDVVGLPGCVAYGANQTEAINRAMDLAIAVLTEKNVAGEMQKS